MNLFESKWKTVAAQVAMALLLGVPTVPTFAQDRSEEFSLREQFMQDLETMESKFVELADAMDADMYGWRPMRPIDSVRTVSEVYMLIAAENYVMPSAWGAEPPEGMTEVSFAMFGELAKVVDKAEVLDHLRKSFAYCKQTIEAISDADMDMKIRFFGAERSLGDSFYIMASDMHEHLGQAIAYARMNHVVPPWTARRQQGQ